MIDGGMAGDVPRHVWLGRLAAFAMFAAWGTAVVLSRMTEPPTVLHLTVILFHEAGHVLFASFGQAMAMKALGVVGLLAALGWAGLQLLLQHDERARA